MSRSRHSYYKHGRYERDIPKIHDHRTPLEELPEKEAMRPRFVWFGGGNSSTYVKRFLNRSVGKPWNDVHSKLVAKAKELNVPQFNYEWFICFPGEDVKKWRSDPFYIDNNGILQREPDSPKWKRKPLDPNYIPIDNSSWYQKINGCWFSVKGCWGIQFYKLMHWHIPHDKSYELETKVYDVKKIQLNKKELTKLGLQNDNQLL